MDPWPPTLHLMCGLCSGPDRRFANYPLHVRFVNPVYFKLCTACKPLPLHMTVRSCPHLTPYSAQVAVRLVVAPLRALTIRPRLRPPVRPPHLHRPRSFVRVPHLPVVCVPIPATPIAPSPRVLIVA